MPANLTPEYMKAEKWFREATTTEEKILALERMLSVIPKHKGTDHMRAELRRKLSKLKEVSVQRGGKGTHTDIFHIPRTGAGQIALIGTPSSGKSSVVAAITHAKVTIADFPFATTVPVPGMVRFEDVQFQIIDMPPITEQYCMPGQIDTYRHCDLIAIVIDLSADIAGQLKASIGFLESRNLIGEPPANLTGADKNLFSKKAFYLGTKNDIAQPDAVQNLQTLSNHPFEIVTVSVKTNEGIANLPALLFKMLGLIRVYTKPPGKKPDLTEPFTLPAGSTVHDLAAAIHKELSDKLKDARIWGTGVYDGQNVQKNHILNDKDVVELHFHG